MAVDTSESAVATFILEDADGTPINDAEPTFTFYHEDGTTFGVREGADVSHTAGTNVYSAAAVPSKGGICTVVLTATSATGRQLREEALVVAVDRAEERIIRGY